MGGVADETLRSGGGAQRAEAEAQERGGGSRRSSSELGEERIGDASRQRRIGLGFDRERERESEEGAAEPGRAGSVKPPWWTDRWARAVSPFFLFLINCFGSKTFKKNPNLFKNKPEKNTKNNKQLF
jgi:hypothetical protein